MFLPWAKENLGPRPEGCQIDRIDNDGPYGPGNLQLASKEGQMRNRRCTVLSEFLIYKLWRFLGLGYSLVKISKILGVNTSALSQVKNHKTWKDVSDKVRHPDYKMSLSVIPGYKATVEVVV